MDFYRVNFFALTLVFHGFLTFPFDELLLNFVQLLTIIKGKTYPNLKNSSNKFFRNQNSHVQISQKPISKVPVKLGMLFYLCL